MVGLILVHILWGFDMSMEEEPAVEGGQAADLSALAEAPDVAEMPAEVRRAFYTYFASSSRTKSGRRSLNQVADLLEIPIGTVRSWSTRYGWPSIANRIDQSADVESMQAAMVAAAALRPNIVAALRDIAFSTEGVKVSERLHALAQLRELTGLVRIPSVVAPNNEEEDTYAGYSEADLVRLASSVDPADQRKLQRLALGQDR